MENECVLLMLGCDKNIDLVELNLDMIKRFWPDCPFPVYISLETYHGNYGDNIKIMNSNETKWSKRIMEHLAGLNSKYVMITLDDFIIEDFVHTQTVVDCINFMNENPQVVNMAFDAFNGKRIPGKDFKHFQCRKKRSNCLLNWQIGLWRTDNLIELMDPNENPWESEVFGSMRAELKKESQFYCLDVKMHKPIEYNNGWLVVRGCWNGNEIKRLEQKLNIKIDTGDRLIKYKDFQYISFFPRVKRRLKIIFKRYNYKIKSRLEA